MPDVEKDGDEDARDADHFAFGWKSQKYVYRETKLHKGEKFD